MTAHSVWAEGSSDFGITQLHDMFCVLVYAEDIDVGQMLDEIVKAGVDACCIFLGDQLCSNATHCVFSWKASHQ